MRQYVRTDSKANKAVGKRVDCDTKINVVSWTSSKSLCLSNLNPSLVLSFASAMFLSALLA